MHEPSVSLPAAFASRPSRVLRRNLRGAAPPIAVGGHGVWLRTADGREILDVSGGAAVSCLEHGHPQVIAAIQRQAGALPIHQVIRNDGRLDQACAHGALLEQRLYERFGNHRHIGDIRGRRLFVAIEDAPSSLHS